MLSGGASDLGLRQRGDVLHGNPGQMCGPNFLCCSQTRSKRAATRLQAQFALPADQAVPTGSGTVR
jgi:hypothetical protein